MDAVHSHSALGVDHEPPPTPSAPAPSPAQAEPPGGGRNATPTDGELGRNATPTDGELGRTPLVSALKESVWAPVAAKASAIAVGMLGLAAIGAWSTLAGAGVPVSAPVPRASVDGHAAWVAPDHAGQHGGAPAAAPPSEAAVAEPSASGSTAAAPSATSSGVTSDGRVVLNTATVDDLVKLPRVGPKRAQAIIDLRKRIGKFRKPTDLLRVRGIGRKTLVLMLPKLVVDAPTEPPK